MITYLVILIFLASIIVSVLFVLSTWAVLLSKISFALFFSLFTASKWILVANSSGLNYLAWLIVNFGIFYLISMLPKADVALKVLSTIIISTLILELLVTGTGSFITIGTGKSFSLTTAYEIAMKLVCAVLAFLAFVIHGRKPAYNPSPLARNADRFLASIQYGVTAAYLYIPLTNTREITNAGLLTVLIIATVLTFVMDVFLAGKDILGLEEPQEVIMPK